MWFSVSICFGSFLFHKIYIKLYYEKIRNHLPVLIFKKHHNYTHTEIFHLTVLHSPVNKHDLDFGFLWLHMLWLHIYNYPCWFGSASTSNMLTAKLNLDHKLWNFLLLNLQGPQDWQTCPNNRISLGNFQPHSNLNEAHLIPLTKLPGIAATELMLE